MADIAVTRVSSRGQVVIPQELREGFEEGDTLIVIREGKNLLMKPTSEFNKNIEEDLLFARRTTAALKRYEKGECEELSFDEFLERAKKW